ncbi:hypothetical protein RHBI111906_06200 [Rhodothermus bifroesti]
MGFLKFGLKVLSFYIVLIPLRIQQIFMQDQTFHFFMKKNISNLHLYQTLLKLILYLITGLQIIPTLLRIHGVCLLFLNLKLKTEVVERLLLLFIKKALSFLEESSIFMYMETYLKIILI